MTDRTPGRFITLEGGEGAGKSTQLRRLSDMLDRAGYSTLATREPGGSPGAEAIRSLLVKGETGRWDAITELLLHYAARRDHLERTIRPAMDRGTWVICDRFADSTMAYQGYGLKLGRDPVERLQTLAIGDFRPDLTLILDVPPKIGLDRAKGRDADAAAANRYERMDAGFHQRVRDGFLDIARRDPDRCVIIAADAEANLVHARICEAVRDRLDIQIADETP